jgi:chromosome segregation ATPase
MEPTKLSLAQRIDALARRTGASAAFVERVRALFADKGIDLRENAEPFEASLVHAFERHAEVKRNVESAQRSLGRLQARLAEINDAYEEQASRLRGIRELVERQARQLAVIAPPRASRVQEHRLVRGEWDLTIVPGPEGIH